MRLLKLIRQNPSARYLTPLLVFLTLTSFQGSATSESIFWMYTIKTLLTGMALLYCFHGHWREIQGKFDWLAVGIGILVLVIWILPETLFPEERAIAFNPMVFDSPIEKIVAIFFRMLGACLIVPVVEELAWRSFLMRYLIRTDFLSVPLGTYRPLSFWVTAGSFALMHASWQWPVALVTGIFYGGYLIKTKNLAGCMIAHATTNLGLAIFVLATGQWKFW